MPLIYGKMQQNIHTESITTTEDTMRIPELRRRHAVHPVQIAQNLDFMLILEQIEESQLVPASSSGPNPTYLI